MKVYGTVNILGDFWPQRTSDISGVGWSAADEGRILYDADNYGLYYGSSTGWEKLTDSNDLFIVGTKLVFASTLPTGWNIDTECDDKVIMLTNSTSQIGTVAGSWVLSGFSTHGGHNHFTPDGMGGATPEWLKVKSGQSMAMAAVYHKHTLPIKGSHTHLFDGNWRPARVKFAVGIYGG